jgi:hypothetical protein
MEAFRVSTRAIGIDLIRSVYTRNLGTYVSAPAATYRAGMLVELDAQQQIQACGSVADVTNPFGFTKYTKANTLYAAVVGEEITLDGVVDTALKHGGLWAPGATGGVKVYNLATGAAYAEGAGSDYVVTYANGLIKRAAGSTIADGQTVGVTYQYQVTEQELKFEGRNFWNLLNDVDIQNGLISVITDWSIIFTTQYDPTGVYAVNQKLYAGDVSDGKQGLVTPTQTALTNLYVGRVFQVPTASDPFLGIQFAGGALS